MREGKGTMYRGAARVVPRSRRFNTLACTQSLSEGAAPPASMTRVDAHAGAADQSAEKNLMRSVGRRATAVHALNC